MAGSRGSATTSRSPGGGFFYGYVVAAAAAFIMVLVFSVHYSFGVFFLPLLTEFGWTRA